MTHSTRDGNGGDSDYSRTSSDEMGITLLSVLLGVGLSAFSIARPYVAAWVAVAVAVVFIGVVIAAIKLSTDDGWLKKIGRWLLE